jgi:hypothetical protein
VSPNHSLSIGILVVTSALGFGACGDAPAGGSAATGSAAQGLGPFACPARASATVFVEEDAPSSVAAGATVSASVTFANCSGATWTAAEAGASSGVKIGFAAPRDGLTWGVSRVALPSDVPHGMRVTIPLSLRAPADVGDAPYQWSVVDEGVAWLDAASPRRVVHVLGGPGAPPAATPPSSPPTSPSVTLCPGVDADASGSAPASAAIQRCVDAASPGDVLELPPGTYRVTSEISLTKPLTIRTAGASGHPMGCLGSGAPACAILRADTNLAVTRGFLRIAGTSDVTLDHVALDGNRSARLGSTAAAQCAAGNTGPGFNASSSGCTHCALVGTASINALCGSGFEWKGDDLLVAGCLFRDNGDHDRATMWADGLTLLQSDRARVDGNLFADNSDVDLICGGANGGTFTNNHVVHSRQGAFAGLMLDNFDGTTSGDFRGAVVSNNTVDCGARLCDFAVELGPHPWYLSANTLGGTVSGNTVSGGKIGINVEGAGTPSEPIVVTGNTVAPSPSSAQFSCGTRTTTTFNVSPDSFVDLGAGPQPTGAFAFHGCP